MEDGFDRALRNACFAVDALFRMNVQYRFTLVEAFDRANDDTIGVFAVEARFGDDVCHQTSFQSLNTAPAMKREVIGTVGLFDAEN